MTKESISEIEALKTLLSEGPDPLVLAEMLGFVADRLMALDADQLCGAGKHERSADRANHRNGYRPRAWETRAGRVDLKIPKLRKGSCFPEFLEPRRAQKRRWPPSFRKPTCRASRPDPSTTQSKLWG